MVSPPRGGPRAAAALPVRCRGRSFRLCQRVVNPLLCRLLLPCFSILHPCLPSLISGIVFVKM